MAAIYLLSLLDDENNVLIGGHAVLLYALPLNLSYVLKDYRDSIQVRHQIWWKVILLYFDLLHLEKCDGFDFLYCLIIHELLFGMLTDVNHYSLLSYKINLCKKNSLPQFLSLLETTNTTWKANCYNSVLVWMELCLVYMLMCRTKGDL